MSEFRIRTSAVEAVHADRLSDEQETVWLKTPASTLSWRISEADLQRLKAYSPKFKCYVHTGEKP